MTVLRTYQLIHRKAKLSIAILSGVAFFILANVFIDFYFSGFQNSSFYISESLLFSSYWVLFLPLLAFAAKTIKRAETIAVKLLLAGVTILLHLFSYPALVWLISSIFYYHTFDYWQTFNFGLPAYFLKTVIIYGFSFAAFTLVSNRAREEVENPTQKQGFLSAIWVTDHDNKKLLLQVGDIFHFSANPPYVSIYHSSKKYLHTGTLKSLEAQLDKKLFVRIHKSHIVNILKVSSIQSRQNGDYDITLSDGTALRVSRNYAGNFKARLEGHTQLSVK